MKLISLMLLVSQLSFAYLVDESVDLNKGLTIDEANAKVEALMKTTKVVNKEYFCVKKELTCRTHYTLGDLHGNLINAFFVRFVAVDRSVGGNGYFFPVKGQPGKFVRAEDFSYDGKFNMNTVELENVVDVEKSADGSVKAIRNILTPKLGTTQVTNATITVGQDSTVLEGTTYDKADPNFVPVKTRIEYLRTEITN